MKYTRSTFFSNAFILTVYLMAGCYYTPERNVSSYNKYKFDDKVIEKLSLYDSLVFAIVQNISSFQQSANLNDSYQAYRYLPGSRETDVYKDLPRNIGLSIDYYYKKLGSNFIYGFDVFKDSSIKIYVRTYRSAADATVIEENLSYYTGKYEMRKREYPDRDTVLTNHWQYWTRFRKQGLF
jgi:hypothetical protein